MTSRIPEDKPKWANLKNNQCPKCGSILEHDQNSLMHTCPRKEACGFKISDEAFNRVVTQLYKPRTRRNDDDRETLDFLNNFGHNRMSADFSGDESLREGYEG